MSLKQFGSLPMGGGRAGWLIIRRMVFNLNETQIRTLEQVRGTRRHPRTGIHNRSERSDALRVD